ncbi:MAG: hypothetical protein K0U66_07385 [Gammaproteobacteria bacterium]|nr:hypothetical protein [Gammaproteobacteria bacterium]
MFIQHPSKVIRQIEIIGMDEDCMANTEQMLMKDMHDYLTSEEYFTRHNPRETILYFKFTFALSKVKSADAIVPVFTKVLEGFKDMFSEVSAPSVTSGIDAKTQDITFSLNYVAIRAKQGGTS